MNKNSIHCVVNSGRNKPRIFDIRENVEIRESLPLNSSTKKYRLHGLRARPRRLSACPQFLWIT